MIISAYSKQCIERLIPKNNSILISITGTLGNFAEVNDELYNGVLRLKFSDIQKDFGKFLAFKEDQANEILNFINNYKPNYVYVNCEHGRSRSTAIVSSLERIYNDRIINFPHQNVHVKDTLLKIANII